MNGKLIVLEGIDGSGKSTQFKMLCDRLTKDNVGFHRVVFPQYSQPSSALIKMYLSGQFGADPDSVNAYAASTFFAVDRYASFKRSWKDDYENGLLILADRYTTSNATHQGSKLASDERAAFFDWLYDFEFRLLKLPKPDAVFYMDIPLELSLENMAARQRETGVHGDIHETDAIYLKKCLKSAKEAAMHYGWHMIKCAENGVMRPADEISDELYEIVRKEL